MTNHAPAPKPKPTPNAFTIPEKSSVVEGNRAHFRSRPKHFPQNLPPIVLDGSSKYPAPKMMKAPK